MTEVKEYDVLNMYITTAFATIVRPKIMCTERGAERGISFMFIFLN